MKKYLLGLALTVTAFCAQGQFVYDQQSTPNDSGGGAIAANFHTNDSIGQSFTPILPSVDFIRLFFSDASGNTGAEVYLNLWSGSIGTGTLLDSTTPLFLPTGFNNFTNFIFQNPVTLTPNTTYFFQPVVQPGSDLLNIGLTTGTAYPNGTAYFQGVPNTSLDLWFREGEIVPEPSVISLILLGAVGLSIRRRKS